MIVDRIILTREGEAALGLNDKISLNRNIAKVVSWRIVGTLDTVLLSWIITGNLNTALSIGGVELITKMLLFAAHERLWNKINRKRS